MNIKKIINPLYITVFSPNKLSLESQLYSKNKVFFYYYFNRRKKKYVRLKIIERNDNKKALIIIYLLSYMLCYDSIKLFILHIIETL